MPPRLSGPEFKADPYPAYAALRDEDPAFCRTSADGIARLWFITRYEDVAAALRDQRRFVKDVRNTLTEEERAALPPAPELYDLLTHHMLNADGAQHARLRALVGKAFAARRVDQLEPRIAALAAALLDRLQPRGHMDLIEEFSLPFSIAVIAELLGIPSRDRQRFPAWSHVLVAPSADSARNERKTVKLRPAMADFVAYLGALCEERRRAPQNDLISTLLQAEDDGARLTPEELYSMVLLLTVVGHETSVYLIGNCVLTLLLHPPALAQVRQAPELLPQAIEEMIRYDGPVERATMRFAAEDIHLHGQVIHRGDAVSLALAAAHRDPRICCAGHTRHRPPRLPASGFWVGCSLLFGRAAGQAGDPRGARRFAPAPVGPPSERSAGRTAVGDEPDLARPTPAAGAVGTKAGRPYPPSPMQRPPLV